MQIVEVKTKKESRAFIELPPSLYRDSENWIRPIDKEIEAIFDPAQNKSFANGSCVRWLLRDSSGYIGRIAAFVLNKTRGEENEISARVGFFECIDNQDAANLLFDTARSWLTNKGASYMDGPVNFGPRDKWWGLLTKGFELEPNYQCNYNFPYYQELFENYGFQVYFEHYTFVKLIREEIHPRLHYKAQVVSQDHDFTMEHFELKKFDKYTADIIEVYNKAWVNHEDVSPISLEQGKSLMKRIKPVIEEKLIWLAYYKGQAAAVFMTIPEVNQILKYVNGKLDLIGKLKFLWYKSRIKKRKVLGLLFGVVPEHQGKGVDGAIIRAFQNEMFQNFPQFETIEMHGIGDFNRKMILVVKQVGGDVRKIHTTYRYLFDREQPFERMKSMR